MPLQAFRIRLSSCVLGVWITGVGILAFRHLRQARHLDGMIRRSERVTDKAVAEWTDLAGQSAARPSVDVRRSAEVHSPCLARAWRPVLLLPERGGSEHDPGEIARSLPTSLRMRGITTWPGMISSTWSRYSCGSIRLSGGFVRLMPWPVTPFVMPWRASELGDVASYSRRSPGWRCGLPGLRSRGAWRWPGLRMSAAGLMRSTVGSFARDYPGA